MMLFSLVCCVWVLAVVVRSASFPQPPSSLGKYYAVFKGWLDINFWYRQEAMTMSGFLSNVLGYEVPFVSVHDVPLFVSATWLAVMGGGRVQQFCRVRGRQALRSIAA